jgi:hypothetical protein
MTRCPCDGNAEHFLETFDPLDPEVIFADP